MQCRHRNCTCQVTEAEQFCSDFCRHQSDDDSLVVGEDFGSGEVVDCGCGHAACVVLPPITTD
jgi:hypothetical protein